MHCNRHMRIICTENWLTTNLIWQKPDCTDLRGPHALKLNWPQRTDLMTCMTEPIQTSLHTRHVQQRRLSRSTGCGTDRQTLTIRPEAAESHGVKKGTNYGLSSLKWNIRIWSWCNNLMYIYSNKRLIIRWSGLYGIVVFMTWVLLNDLVWGAATCKWNDSWLNEYKDGQML